MKNEKLVRDEIPKIIKESGREPQFRTATDDELGLFIKNKVMEEAQEVIEAKNKDELIEELADLTSVIERLIDFYEIDRDDITASYFKKGNSKGFFDKGYILEIP